MFRRATTRSILICRQNDRERTEVSFSGSGQGKGGSHTAAASCHAELHPALLHDLACDQSTIAVIAVSLARHVDWVGLSVNGDGDGIAHLLKIIGTSGQRILNPDRALPVCRRVQHD